MQTFIRSFFLTLALGLSAAAFGAESDVNCYRDACVGDHAVNLLRGNREVTVVAIDNYGKFLLRFEDTGAIGGNWDRDDLALMRGCSGDLCVGFPALNVARNYRAVHVHALQANGKFVLRFDDGTGVGSNWDRPDLAVAWGCVSSLCVNDLVYNRTNGRQAKIAAIQISLHGVADRMVLNYGASGVGGGWEFNDLVLLERGPPAYPPAPTTPTACPPGTQWDPRIGRCVADLPPPARNWECSIQKPGRVFVGRGPTRGAATQAALTGCARASGGYVCRATEAACHPY